MLGIYNFKYDKFDSKTLSNIHFNIFGQIYDWSVEYCTIQIVKYEEVIGGDTVGYAHTREIKNKLVKLVSRLVVLEKSKVYNKKIFMT